MSFIVDPYPLFPTVRHIPQTVLSSITCHSTLRCKRAANIRTHPLHRIVCAAFFTTPSTIIEWKRPKSTRYNITWGRIFLQFIDGLSGFVSYGEHISNKILIILKFPPRLVETWRRRHFHGGIQRGSFTNIGSELPSAEAQLFLTSNQFD